MLKKLIVLLFVLLTVSPVFAADWYVRPSSGEYGVENGVDWNTAFDGFSGINWGAVSCGDTIWVSGGSYNQWFYPNKNCTVGSQLYIRRARSDASACTSAAGWDAGFDSLITQNSTINFDSSTVANYITISGRTTTSGGDYGWKTVGSGTAPWPGIRIWSGSTTNNVTFEYMEIAGPGGTAWTGNAKGIYDAPSGGSGGFHTYSHMKIHGWATGIFLNYKSDHIIEYIDMYDIAGNATEHANLMYIINSNRGTVRYSKFHDSSASGTGIAFSDGGPFENWKIYGNIFYDNNTGSATAIAVQRATITGLKIFNNTFSNNVYNFRLSSASCGTGTESRNNIVHGTGGSVACGSTSNNLTTSDSGIFVNRGLDDFHIVSTIGSGYPRDIGTNLSTTFTVDMDGTTFGGDGTWDVGAYEYAGGGSDTTPPVRSNGYPTGVLPPGTTTIDISLDTNENATCKYDTSAGVAYGSMANTFTTTGGMTHSQNLTGLTNGGSYTYYVRCQDGVPNANTDDYTISFSVASSFAVDTWIEAENCARISPMTTGLESGTTYVYTPSVDQGSISCSFNVTTGGIYRVNTNVKATSGSSNSFYVSAAGVTTDAVETWDSQYETAGSPNYVNDYVSRRGTGTFDAPEYDPRDFNLSTGTTTITFTGREVDTRLNQVYLEYIGAAGGCTPAKVTFTTQPGGGIEDTVWSQQPVVEVKDSGDVTCTDATNSVTLAIGTDPGSGTLTCTTNPKAAVGGVVGFQGCYIDNPGTGYTLTAAAAGLTGDTSSAFNITAQSLPTDCITCKGSGVLGLSGLDKKIGTTNSFTIGVFDTVGNGINYLDTVPPFSEILIKVKCGSRQSVTIDEEGDTLLNLGAGYYELTTNDTISNAAEEECVIWAEGEGVYADLIAKTPVKFKAVGATVDAVKVAPDYTGAVVYDAGNTASTFKTNLPQTADGHWLKAGIVITSGPLSGQVRQVTGYNGTTKFITVSPGFTGIPGDTVTFRIMNQ